MRQPESDDSRWQSRFQLRWSWTVSLLVAYAVVFVLEILLSPAPGLLIPGNAFCNEYFALSRTGLEHGYVWQLVTYQFMHAGWMHLLLNGWVIYTFGGELERLFGAKRFLALMLSSGIVGGVFQVGTAVLWPGLFDGAVVGASACAFGLVAAFALVYPERELTLLVFYIIPVQMRAKTLLIFCAVLAVAGIVFSKSILGGNIAHAAHLGGMAMGWFFVRNILQGDCFHQEGDGRGFSKRAAVGSPPLQTDKSTAEIVADEVDPILDKISAHGIQSLTARERATLEAARQKMVPR